MIKSILTTFLSIHKPTGPNHILSLLSFGAGNRTQHATDAYSESSRSHTVLQVFLKYKDRAAGFSSEAKLAKMSLIDLAASEKGCITGNKGARFREGSNINKSLLALKICINALADGSKHILYRRSKLTRLLKDSIGGNRTTVMIANVSPSSAKFKVTVNTLKYADRVKDIKINHSPAPLLSKDKSFLNAFDPEPSTPKKAAEEISDMVSA